MYVNVAKLKGKICEYGYNGERFAKAINITPATFYRKLKKNADTFTVEQIYKMAEILQLSRDDMMGIFFSKNSQ